MRINKIDQRANFRKVRKRESCSNFRRNFAASGAARGERRRVASPCGKIVATRAFKFAHAESKYSSHRSVDNREKIDSSEAMIFTNRVAALLYLHLPLMARQLTASMQVTITSLRASETHSAIASDAIARDTKRI